MVSIRNISHTLVSAASDKIGFVKKQVDRLPPVAVKVIKIACLVLLAATVVYFLRSSQIIQKFIKPLPLPPTLVPGHKPITFGFVCYPDGKCICQAV